MLTRWNTQRCLVRAGYERVLTMRFPAGRSMPAVSGSSLTRPKYPKKSIDGEKASADPADLESWELSAAEELEAIGKQMSNRTARKIRENIHAMYAAGKAKTFITLTFVNTVSDGLAVRTLGKLLKLWRDQWEVYIELPDGKKIKDQTKRINYLWVAERQKNGRIHFHLVLDRKIDIKKENARWVRVQYNSGIEFMQTKAGELFHMGDPNGMTNQEISQRLNPLDVDYIRTADGLAKYLAGYVTKSIGETFYCQMWHCSRQVSQCATSVMVGAGVHKDLLQTFPGAPNTYVYKQDIKNKAGRIVRKAGDVLLPRDGTNEFCSWVYVINRAAIESYEIYLTDFNKEVFASQWPEVMYYDYREYAHNFLLVEDKYFDLAQETWHSVIDRDGKLVKRFNTYEEKMLPVLQSPKERRRYFVLRQRRKRKNMLDYYK